MVAPYAAATSVQSGNKCPHGLPPGACPICSGMGGGSMRKDRDKPRVPGEMTYAECMAEWIKIQAAQEAKIQAQIQKAENAQARLLENKILMAVDKVEKFLKRFPMPLAQNVSIGMANEAYSQVSKFIDTVYEISRNTYTPVIFEK